MHLLTADAAGWVAAALTACCFASTRMLRLRALALLANLAFITYGSLAGLAPVLMLHLMLAPLNAWHLLRQWRAAQSDRGPARREALSQALPPTFGALQAPQPVVAAGRLPSRYRHRPGSWAPAPRQVRRGESTDSSGQ